MVSITTPCFVVFPTFRRNDSVNDRRMSCVCNNEGRSRVPCCLAATALPPVLRGFSNIFFSYGFTVFGPRVFSPVLLANFPLSMVVAEFFGHRLVLDQGFLVLRAARPPWCLASIFVTRIVHSVFFRKNVMYHACTVFFFVPYTLAHVSNVMRTFFCR